MSKFSKILIEIIKEDTNSDLLAESNLPLIGVFWLYNEEIIGDTHDPKDPSDCIVQNIEGETVVVGKKNHFSIWHNIVPKEIDDKDHNYLYLPRGRVMFLSNQKKFIIYANKIFNNLKLRSKIKRYYNLSENNIIWNFDDEHYN